MSRKSSRQSRSPRQPAAPRGPRAPGVSSNAPRSARPAGVPTAAPSEESYDDNLSTTYRHVARDLRRIFVLAIVMFGLIYGSTLVADALGSNFVIETIR